VRFNRVGERFPEKIVARLLGQVADLNPRSAGIARKVVDRLGLELILRAEELVEEPVRIVQIRLPTRSLGCVSFNAQSDVLPPLDFGVVFVKVGQSLVELPESFARRYGQVVEVNPFVIKGAGITGKIFEPMMTYVIIIVEDPVGIVAIRTPNLRFGDGRINRQSDLSAPLNFGLVIVNVGQSVKPDRLRASSLLGFPYIPRGLVDFFAIWLARRVLAEHRTD
jgi:hypothetical protein